VNTAGKQFPKLIQKFPKWTGTSGSSTPVILATQEATDKKDHGSKPQPRQKKTLHKKILLHDKSESTQGRGEDR
jgi:hypothetical protein